MSVTPKQLVSGILAINVLLLLYGLFNSAQPAAARIRQLNLIEDTIFNHHWEESPQWEMYQSTLQLSKSHQQIENDRDYCQKVYQFREEYPLVVNNQGKLALESRVVFSDFARSQYPKRVYEGNVRFVMRQHYAGMNSTYIGMEPLREDITMFFHLTALWHTWHEIGTHFLCEGQMYNHIPGNIYLSYKDTTASRLREYHQAYYKDRPHCFNPWEVHPYTIVLDDKVLCKKFIRELKTTSQNPIQWVFKKSRGAHNGKGVFIVDDEVAQEIVEQYDSGKKCGELKGYMVQKYVGRPFLINNKKFDFRAYLVIASMDPLIILYHDGFLRITLTDFDESSSDLTAHLTNTVVAEKQLKDAGVTGDDEHERLKDQGWSFDHFNDWMKEKGYGDEFLNTYVKPKMKKIMFHIVRMNLDKLLHHPRVFEYFGLDFLLDQDFNVWFIELNLTPSIADTNEEKDKINRKFLTDLMDLEYAKLQGQGFDQVLEQSKFEVLYDGRIQGFERYNGILEEECA